MNRVIDLTLTLREGMRGVTFRQVCRKAVEGWNAKTLELYSHCGTHMDAPHHFDAGQGTIDTIPLEQCMGRAWLVDMEPVSPAALIGVKDLGTAATLVVPGDSLLLKTGWSRYVENPVLYRDKLPRISVALAEWCVEHQIRMLGVEPPSVADVNNMDELTRVHTILLAGGVTIVEGLANLEGIRDQQVFFCAVPLKIDGGDGAPCRAFALETLPPEEHRGPTRIGQKA